MEDVILRFESAMNELERKTHLMWNNVKTITLDAIIAEEIDLHSLSKRCDALSDINHKIIMGLYSELEKMPEDDYYGTELEDRHNSIETRSHRVGEILRVIETAIDGFRKMAEEVEESEVDFQELGSDPSLSQEA